MPYCAAQCSKNISVQDQYQRAAAECLNMNCMRSNEPEQRQNEAIRLNCLLFCQTFGIS